MRSQTQYNQLPLYTIQTSNFFAFYITFQNILSFSIERKFKLITFAQQQIMSLQRGGNYNRSSGAKRIYNLTTLNNNNILLDVYKSQDTKLTVQSNPLSINNNNKNDLFQDKNTILSITGKEVVCPNFYNKSNQKKRESAKHDMQHFARNIKEIKLILQEEEQSKTNHDKREDDAINQDQGEGFLDGVGNYEKQLEQYNDVKKYYEQAIASHPMIYKQVVSAYKHLQRAINSNDKANIDPKKRLSTNKITGVDRLQNLRLYKQKPLRSVHKLTDNQPKNDQQKKKILYFNIYREFQLLLNLSNEVVMIPEQEGQYKAYIGKGNNGLLVKSILKSRPWWCIRAATDVENCNLIWTEWKKPKYMKMLPNSSKPLKKDTINPSVQTYQTFKQNKKFQHVSKILPQNKMIQIITCFDLKQGEQITKFNKKISDESFTLIAQKNLALFDQKKVCKINKMINHIPGCFQLHSKKLLFANLKKYYQKKKLPVYDYLPQTYVISKGLNDPQYQRFLQAWQSHEKRKDNKTNRNIWICKPGENSNRGNGITVAGSLSQIKNFISSHSSSNGMCSALIQKYMQNPFLYNKRKFDIRCYILITTVNGIVKGYWYEQGYIRTTSKQYNLKNIQNKFIHLTNDAVQKKGQTYGKFESFNKVTFSDFEKYLEQNFAALTADWKDAQIKMKQMATDLIHSVGKKLNPDKKQFSFELFGLDFMLDDKLQAFIIEANSNPCIEVEGNVLGRVIPSMLENVIRIVIDPIFPPPYSESSKNTKYSPGNVIEQNKFALVYDSLATSQNDQQILHISKQQEQEERLLQAEIQKENQEQI